jgi:beta-lactam-binding protein with PASTA domain
MAVNRRSRILAFSVALTALIALTAVAPRSQAETTRQLVTTALDEQQTVELPGNIRPEARAAYDRGPVAASTILRHMQLLLRRPPETEATLVHLIDQLHDPASHNFHRWLTSGQLREGFGPAQADVDAVSAWLAAHGLIVNGVHASGMVIDFSGTAGQVRDTFNTEIHALDVRGVAHIANMSNPRIPVALTGVVQGVVSLHDFRPHTNFRPRPNYTVGGNAYLVVPADLWTIYNFSPLFSAGITGAGETVVVIEDSNVFSTADWTAFRTAFGLSSYTLGSFTQVQPAPPSGPNNCSNPGVNSASEGEATLDAEWASAAAPNAAIELASCADTNTTPGMMLALENLLDSAAPPGIVSSSYGECEALNGTTANDAWYTLYQQGVALGVSIFVAAGDELAAGCNYQSAATFGIGVSAFASTPYNVAVGGTDFGDAYLNNSSAYWSGTNSSSYGSALSYVPEIPWNGSCASVLVATAAGFSTTYGSNGYCNSGQGEVENVGGSGGPSGCATGNPAVLGVVGGTCEGWPKPSWQSVAGNPADGVRDLPDVSLFASAGSWNSAYVYCFSDVINGGAVCSGQPPYNWSLAGGTSFAAPIMAGIQALANQKLGANQGNPNAVYYALAQDEYGPAGSSACNSTLGNGVASTCIFYDVTLGDNDAPCTGTVDCYLPGGATGALSLSGSSDEVAYPTTTGWDFATGIGSINVANLVNSWSASTQVLTLSPPSVTYTPTAVGSTSAARVVTLKSAGTSAVTLTSETIKGSNISSFLISANTCGSSLAAGASCTVSVEFKPAAAGSLAASLSIANSVVGSPQAVALAGATSVSVPNVVGLTQAAAANALTGAGLAVGTTSTASSATVPSGSVISENPVAGTSVGYASSVNLTISTGPPVSVPNVVGLTQAAAMSALTGAGLIVGTVSTASSGTVPSGSVISESPLAGTSVATGSAVSLTVSTGAVPVSVPNVVGLTQAAATSALTGAGLIVGTVSTTSSGTVPSGSVISENPVAGTSVATGSSVSLSVSTGPVLVSVPNVVGLTEAAATSALSSAGLMIGTIGTVRSATVPAGSVISENPVAGTSVATGSAVNLTFSAGPPPVSVPNVVGLTQAAATSALTSDSLTVGTISTASSVTVTSGSVISESPVAGTSVAANSAVNLLVSTGPAPALPSYNAGQLTLPSVVIGGATYSNMVVNVGNIVSGPMGTTANGSEDIYYPASNQMTVPAVVVGAHTYYNVVITVGSLVGIGSVSGADVYNGTELSIGSVQVVGGEIYSNVSITPGNIINVAGGMPNLVRDSYDPATKQLKISAVEFGNHVYTNVIITVAKVDSVG